MHRKKFIPYTCQLIIKSIGNVDFPRHNCTEDWVVSFTCEFSSTLSGPPMREKLWGLQPAMAQSFFLTHQIRISVVLPM